MLRKQSHSLKDWRVGRWWSVSRDFDKFWYDDRVVESVGKDVSELKKGDVVIPVILPECGECIDCKSSKSNRCTNFPFKVSPWMPRHGSSRFTDKNGDIIYHFLFISSFSEYTVVDIANIIKIDPHIPPDRACLLGCGVSTGKLL